MKRCPRRAGVHRLRAAIAFAVPLTLVLYESIDLIDAFHPQTILAYDMNGAPLPLAHGAPLRPRVERQLGCTMAKFLARIEVVDRLDRIGRGNGGTWEDDGCEWYAGI
jgi:DMSO/TMAO reductase YedYZ molybdopterin-dependent catalytic subunit